MNDTRLNLLFPEKFSGSRDDLSSENLIRWRIKEITAGDTRIVKVYPARADYTQLRKFYGNSSRDSQRKLNKKNSSEHFYLLMQSNFDTDSLYVTFTFAVEPPDKEKVLEKYKYYLKKVRKDAAGEVKYLGVIESIPLLVLFFLMQPLHRRCCCYRQ